MKRDNAFVRNIFNELVSRIFLLIVSVSWILQSYEFQTNYANKYRILFCV